MKYKDNIRKEMLWLSKKKNVVFLGEGLLNAGSTYGTMKSVPKSKCIEMPICENLIVGAAIGIALRGYHPVVVFQRMDFLLIAADAILNHAVLLPLMSGGSVSVPIVLRTIVGSRDPAFDVGPQHRHDFKHFFQRYMVTDTYNPGVYKSAYKIKRPVMIVEDKDKYEEN